MRKSHLNLLTFFAYQEILRLEKALSESQEKLIQAENTRERLEKELESMSDLSNRVSRTEQPPFICQIKKVLQEQYKSS